jgi:hypothetical protein
MLPRRACAVKHYVTVNEVTNCGQTVSNFYGL